MIVEKQRVFRGFRYRLYCNTCRSFVQYANEEQKMILNNLKEVADDTHNISNRV